MAEDMTGWVSIDEAYRNKFGEGAPLWDYSEDEAAKLMNDAINSGVPIPPLPQIPGIVF